MSLTHTLTKTWAQGNDSLSGRKEFTGDAAQEISVSVPATTTDMQVNITIDVSTIVELFLLASGALTVETNDGSSPADTLTLVGDLPETWNSSSNQTNPLGTDVTALYLTNSGSEAVTFNLRVLTDSTP